MAKRNDIAILDIGSHKLSVIIADVNDEMLSIRKDSICETVYPGFCNGKWNDPEGLKNTIRSLLKIACVRNKVSPTTIYIGVPGEFTTVLCQEECVNFGAKKKITQTEIDLLFDSDERVKTHPRYDVINRSTIYYVLPNGKRTLTVLGEELSSIGGLLSYIFCEKTIIETLTRIVKEIGFTDVKFVSSCWVESLYLFDSNKRDNLLVMIDCGYSSSSVVIVKSDGIMYMKSFPLGGAFISADLAETFMVQFEVAEKLKEKLRLSLNVTPDNTYEVTFNNEKFVFNAVKAHEVAITRIEEIAQMVQACLDSCPYSLPEDLPMYLTGGGISYNQGSQVLAQLLGREVDMVAPTFQLLAKPNNSTLYGMLKYACAQESGKKKGFFDSIKKIFNK